MAVVLEKLEDYTEKKWFKGTIYAANVLFAILGILLVIWGGITIGSVRRLLHNNLNTLPTLAIILGLSILVIAIVGITGIKRQSFYITATFFILLAILTILQIALVTWTTINSEKFISKMDTAIDTAYLANEGERGYPFDTIEIIFKCCGLESYEEYGKDIPKSCCGISRHSKEKCSSKFNFDERPGCRKTFHSFWVTNRGLMRELAIVIIIVEVVVLAFAFILARIFRKIEQNVNACTP